MSDEELVREVVAEDADISRADASWAALDRIIRRAETAEAERDRLRDGISALAERARGWEALGAERHLVASEIAALSTPKEDEG